MEFIIQMYHLKKTTKPALHINPKALSNEHPKTLSDEQHEQKQTQMLQQIQS